MRAILFTLCVTMSLLSYAQNADVANVEKHFVNIVKTDTYRNYRNISVLNEVAAYIKNHFEQYSDEVRFQEFEVDGEVYKNVIAIFNSENTKAKTIVIGAHYDVCGDQDGADDNASGVVGLLELARMFSQTNSQYRIELVAYTLEEPPFFRTQNMGSYIHAKSLYDTKTDVYGVLALDMIGFYSEEKKSQRYPIGIMSWAYGSRANFIMLVNKWGKGKFARRFSKAFKRQDAMLVKRMSGPKSIEGLDWSDHLNYWNFGFSSSMITDTSFYRNNNYHKKTDTIETIDMVNTTKVIQAIYLAVMKLK